MIINKLEIKSLNLVGAFTITPQEFIDSRGSFYKFYNEQILSMIGAKPYFVEEYSSVSKKGVLRGFHYQSGDYSQAKLIRCVSGSIYDVIIDLRKSSATFAKWVGIELTAQNKISMYIPRGVAHAFLSLTEGATILYKADNAYYPEYECGVIWNDPDLDIKWPLENPLLTEKDRHWPKLREAKLFE